MTRVSSITSVCECTIANTKDWANVWTLVGNYGSLILQSNQSLVIYMIAVLNCIELLCQEWSYGDAEWKQRNPLLKRNVHWGWSQFNRCNPVSLLQIQSLKIPLSSAAIQPARLSHPDPGCAIFVRDYFKWSVFGSMTKLMGSSKTHGLTGLVRIWEF